MSGPWEDYADEAEGGPWSQYKVTAESLRTSNPGEYDPNSPEFKERNDPTAGMSGLEKLLAGAASGVANVYRGGRQLLAQVADAHGREWARDQGMSFEPENTLSANLAVNDARRLDAPLMATGTGRAGNILGGVAAATPLALVPGANTTMGAILTGGALGSVQPVAEGESRLMNAALGAGGGWAGKLVGDKVASTLIPGRQASASATPGVATATSNVSGNPNVAVRGGGAGFGSVGDDTTGLNSALQAAMAGGRSLGMRATPGQATGSRALQQMEAKLESQPMTSGPFNAIKDANQKVLNRAVADAIGESDDLVDSTVLARANERLGSVFADVRDATSRQVEPRAFVAHLQKVNDEFEGLLPDGRTIAQHPLVQRLFRYAETGQATGEQLGGLTSKLARAAYKETTSASGDREMGEALYMVKDYVDDLIEQGLSGQRLATYQAARGQYRNLINVTRSAGVINPSSGNVNGASLATVLQRTDRHGFLFGKNKTDMYAAARFAQAFRPIVGDSGTATRSMITSPVEAIASLPFNVATRLYTSSPAVHLATAAQGASQAARKAASPVATPALRLASPYLPAAGGLLATYAGQ